MAKVIFVALALLSVWAGSEALAAADPAVIGSVKTTEGACFVVRKEQVLPLASGERLYRADTLQTGKDGKLGMILSDDTVLSLGPQTRILLEQFTFDPAGGRLGMVLKMFRGIASYISGQIAKLAPETVHFETPVATVGVRGTRFLARVEPH